MLKYLLTGLFSGDAEPYSFIENPRPDLFPEKMWNELHRLTAFPSYEQLMELIVKDIHPWERFMAAEKPDVAFELLPEPFQSTLTHFAWIPLFKTLKPEMTTMAIKRFVEKSLGSAFTKVEIIHLKEVYENSKPYTPLLLILTPGNDPME